MLWVWDLPPLCILEDGVLILEQKPIVTEEGKDWSIKKRPLIQCSRFSLP